MNATSDKKLLSWVEIREQFADNWVMVAYSEQEYNKPHDAVHDTRLGTVVCYDTDEDAFFEKSSQCIEELTKNNAYKSYFPTFIHSNPPTQKRRVGYMKKLELV